MDLDPAKKNTGSEGFSLSVIQSYVHMYIVHSAYLCTYMPMVGVENIHGIIEYRSFRLFTVCILRLVPTKEIFLFGGRGGGRSIGMHRSQGSLHTFKGL